jgi:hypothetical protein
MTHASASDHDVLLAPAPRRRRRGLALRGSLVLSMCAGLCIGVAGTASTPRPAFAQSDADKATARSLGQEGQAALDAKDFKAAEDRFRRAESLYHAPTLALGLARALAANGKVVAAQETYNRIIREGVAPGAPGAFVKAVEDAKTEVNAVSPRVAGVTITVAGPDSPKVTLDDTAVPSAALGVRRPVDPGAHIVKASAEGWENVESKFTVAEGGATTVPLTMKKAAAAPIAAAPVPSPAQPASATAGQAPADSMSTAGGDTGVAKGSSQKTIGWVVLGVGGLGLAAGAVTGFLALNKHSDLQNTCPNGTCPASAQGDVDSFHTMGTISTIGFIVGAAGVATGIVLIATAPKAQSSAANAPANKPSVRPFIGVGTVGAVGTF